MFSFAPVESLPDRGERQRRASRRGGVQTDEGHAEIVGYGAVRSVGGVQVPVEHPPPRCRAALAGILGESAFGRVQAQQVMQAVAVLRALLYQVHSGEEFQELAGGRCVRGDEGGDGRRGDVGTGQQAQSPEAPAADGGRVR